MTDKKIKKKNKKMSRILNIGHRRTLIDIAGLKLYEMLQYRLIYLYLQVRATVAHSSLLVFDARRQRHFIPDVKVVRSSSLTLIH